MPSVGVCDPFARPHKGLDLTSDELLSQAGLYRLPGKTKTSSLSLGFYSLAFP